MTCNSTIHLFFSLPDHDHLKGEESCCHGTRVLTVMGPGS
jgi:hypothetical protein